MRRAAAVRYRHTTGAGSWLQKEQKKDSSIQSKCPVYQPVLYRPSHEHTSSPSTLRLLQQDGRPCSRSCTSNARRAV